jgi:hypothetical protein
MIKLRLLLAFICNLTIILLFFKRCQCCYLPLFLTKRCKKFPEHNELFCRYCATHNTFTKKIEHLNNSGGFLEHYIFLSLQDGEKLIANEHGKLIRYYKIENVFKD